MISEYFVAAIRRLLVVPVNKSGVRLCRLDPGAVRGESEPDPRLQAELFFVVGCGFVLYRTQRCRRSDGDGATAPPGSGQPGSGDSLRVAHLVDKPIELRC